MHIPKAPNLIHFYEITLPPHVSWSGSGSKSLPTFWKHPSQSLPILPLRQLLPDFCYHSLVLPVFECYIHRIIPYDSFVCVFSFPTWCLWESFLVVVSSCSSFVFLFINIALYLNRPWFIFPLCHCWTFRLCGRLSLRWSPNDPCLLFSMTLYVILSWSVSWTLWLASNE